MGKLIVCFAAALAFQAGLLGRACADEEKVPLGKVPPAVLEAVRARFAGAEVKGAEKEIEKGETLYEVAITQQGQKIEVTLTRAGTITEIERQVKAADLPRPVAQALESKYPQATYRTLEEVVKVRDGSEHLEYYEVLLETAAHKRLEVAVSPAGKLVKEEAKDSSND